MVTINPSGGGAVTFGYTFKLDDLDNSSSLSGVFDLYRINAVVLRFWPITNNYVTPVTGIPNANIPTLQWATDYTDATAPSTPAVLSRFANLHSVQWNKPISIKLRPAVVSELYRSATTTAYTPKWKQWIDHQYPTVPHYGIKGAITGISANMTVGYFKYMATYYISLKGSK